MLDDIVCRIIGHRRSRRQAHRVDGSWLSRCKRCGVKLVRLRHAEWREPEEVSLLAPRDEDFRGALFERRARLEPAHCRDDFEFHS